MTERTKCGHCGLDMPTYEEARALQFGISTFKKLKRCWGEPGCTDRVVAAKDDPFCDVCLKTGVELTHVEHEVLCEWCLQNRNET